MSSSYEPVLVAWTFSHLIGSRKNTTTRFGVNLRAK